MGTPRLTFTETAMQDLIDLGLGTRDDTTQVEKFIQQSARYTSTEGNRRYYDLIFNVQDHVVSNVTLREGKNTCSTCFGLKTVPQFEICSICDGDGCNACDYEKGSTIPLNCTVCAWRSK